MAKVVINIKLGTPHASALGAKLEYANLSGRPATWNYEGTPMLIKDIKRCEGTNYIAVHLESYV